MSLKSIVSRLYRFLTRQPATAISTRDVVAEELDRRTRVKQLQALAPACRANGLTDRERAEVIGVFKRHLRQVGFTEASQRAINHAALIAKRRYCHRRRQTGPCERLRGALIRQDDRRVKFVGLQAYKDAGGRLAEDLFASTADLIDARRTLRPASAPPACRADPQVAAGMAFAHHLFDSGAFTMPEFEELEPDADYDAYLGNPQVEKVMRTADVKAWRESQRTPEGQPAPSTTPQPAPGREELTVKCAEEIAQARQAALALKVAAMPQLALAIVVQWPDFAIFGCLANPDRDQPMSWHNPAPLPAHFARCNTPRPADLAAQLREVTLPQAQDRRKPFCAERTRDEQARTAIPLEWYIDQPKTALLQILADAVAHALTDPDSREQTTHGSVPPSARSTIRALVDACGLDLADAWKPTPAWLKSYGKAKTLQALASVDEAAKAGEIYEKAAQRLGEARWVPEFGR